MSMFAFGRKIARWPECRGGKATIHRRMDCLRSIGRPDSVGLFGLHGCGWLWSMTAWALPWPWALVGQDGIVPVGPRCGSRARHGSRSPGRPCFRSRVPDTGRTAPTGEDHEETWGTLGIEAGQSTACIQVLRNDQLKVLCGSTAT